MPIEYHTECLIKYFIIGPCSLESMAQVRPIVGLCQKWGITYFRAQLFKPRTSPYSFQGLGTEGMGIIHYLQDQGLKLVSEACSEDQVRVVEQFASIIQIGARNMQNFELLKSIGQSDSYRRRRPKVLLKRGFGNTFSEWLCAAKYIEESGVHPEDIILCERGSRNFASPTGVTLDLGLAYKAKLESNYDILIDPSHGCKDARLVLPLTKASIAMGFSGAMVEVHPVPEESVSDAAQAISVEEMDSFLRTIDTSVFEGRDALSISQ